MRKQDELSNANSCIASAHPKEMVFVLLSRDAAAPFAIRAWADERVRLGKNAETDEQIVEAHACADTMEREARKWVNGNRWGVWITQADHISYWWQGPDYSGDCLLTKEEAVATARALQIECPSWRYEPKAYA